MHLHRSPSGFVVHAPAKLNLFFEVLGKREDGYHEIETLVTPIGLCDTLYFREASAGPIDFACRQIVSATAVSDSGPQSIPAGPTNLVVRAIELLRERSGIVAGAVVRLIKRIPAAAGLGGGSSDAAAALLAANAGWRLGWPNGRLAALGAELGSDVPLFFAGGPAVCRGRGELVEPVGSLGNLHFVVVRPPAGLSTAAVYRVCQPGAPPRRIAPLLEAFHRGNVRKAGRLMFNRLETAAETLSPWIQRLRHELARMDCLGYQMSGSGSCYFGICRHARHARRVAKRLEANGVGIAYAVRGS
ncbi:MAG: 4-(cytidine 5'-diphospho)-2-C-methyl-D-erythritol kinase [Pirellulales bacterium]|nr:4-(cytidine 5'-diphospho)-2-C-methyl-D-erythritol kinase [Pirellulales bacterium]